MLFQRMDAVVSRTGPTSSTVLDRPEAEVVRRTNAERGHKLALRVSRRLTRAAEARARKLAAGGEFSHRGWEAALRKVGYRPGWGAGENIAYGQDDAAEVVGDWMASPGHRRNIEDPKFRTIGVAMVDDERRVWVQVFGRR